MKNGHSKEIDCFGKKLSGNYKNGKKVGEWKYYSYNGDLSSIKTFRDGILNGKCELFNCEGGITLSGSFNNGLKAGLWIEYGQKRFYL